MHAPAPFFLGLLLLAFGLAPALPAATTVGVTPQSFTLPMDTPGNTSHPVTVTVTAADYQSGLWDDITCYIHDPNPPQGFTFPNPTTWTFPSAGHPTVLTRQLTVGITYPTTPGHWVKVFAVYNDFTSTSEYVTVSGDVPPATGLEDYNTMTGVVPVFSPVTGGAATEPLSGSFHRVRFKATYSGLFASSWNWYMDLYHTTGTYRVPLAATQFSAKECYGDLTTAFSLPGNLTWLRDASHHIVTKVSADCLEWDAGTTYSHHCEAMVGIKTRPNRPWLYGDFLSKEHVFKGDTVTLTVKGDGATSYNVYYGRGAATNGTGAKQGRSPIAVKAGATLTLTGLDFRETSFVVKAVNASGESEFSEPVRAAPAIAWQPLGGTWAEGAPVGFAVRATGVPPLAYQWRLNGKPLAGATKASYTMARAQKNAVGTYDVVVTNAAGSVTSEPARLILGDPAGPKK
jgi:hypothetical protein